MNRRNDKGKEEWREGNRKEGRTELVERKEQMMNREVKTKAEKKDRRKETR